MIARHLSALVLLATLATTQASETGADLSAAFRRAQASATLRVAAIGGSITQAGEGWIAPWLRTRLPGVAVGLRSAGMSATGSELGCFRLERDVIASEPDVVLIETAVNDGGLADDEAVRCLESLVRRLAMLPRRPGIVLALAAAKGGARHRHHHAVAAHYGLRCIDLQAAVEARLAAGTRWEELFSDAVHPSVAGHALYATTLAAALEPHVAAPDPGPLPPLPAPLSAKPLWLDGRMWMPGPAPGWAAQPQIGDWWDCFFLGVITTRTPGQPLVLPVRGSVVGAMFALDPKGGGTALVSLDGQPPVEVPCNQRGGYQDVVFGRDLAPGEHRLAIAVSAANPGAIRLGYVLAAGPGSETPVAQGPWTPERLAAFRLDPAPARAFRVAGPVGTFTHPADDPVKALATPLLPEVAAAYRADSVPGPDGPVAVRQLDGEDPRLVFATAEPWRGQVVVTARFRSPRDGELLLGWAVDYFGRLRINGAEVLTQSGGHGGAGVHTLVPVTVKAGWNDLLITVLPGSRGFACDVVIERPTEGVIEWDLADK